MELELREKQKLEEEHFKQIMKWRLENLHRTTKPYELPFQHEKEEELSQARISTQVDNPQWSQTWAPAIRESAPYWQICATKPNTSF